MARRLPFGPENCRTTDHAVEIAWLRLPRDGASFMEALMHELAADLLEAHDDTGISLDDWLPARLFVELLLDRKILKNGI